MPTLIQTSTRNPIVVTAGVTEPALVDAISKDGKTLTDISEVKFSMRPLQSRVPIVDEETAETIDPDTNNGNNVQYDWQEADVAIEGEYMGWWSFDEGSGLQETPEFPILISDHGPGVGVKTGAIVDGVADHMPVTFEALRKDLSFGERRIQKLARLIQERVLKSYVEPDDELGAYPLPLLDYFSKRVALELCTPGIDYWGRQHKSVMAQSPVEQTTFPDMIESLEKLRVRLVDELAENWRELQFFIPELAQRKSIPMPASSLEFEDFNDSSGNLIRKRFGTQHVTANPRLMQPLVTSDRYWGLSLGSYPFP